jgi:photosynthetic reaction center H subunit
MTIIGDFDIAQLCLYAFWAFFIGLIIYLQRETMREGYPMESEVTGKPAMFGLFGLPAPKTFKLPHGHGEVSFPNEAKDAKEITDRKFAMRPTEKWSGSAFEPTGDPLVDGVGPAAWAERADYPELTVEGEIKIVPMSSTNDWSVSERDGDPRGWPVYACDGEEIGKVRDLWIDRSESMIRYVELELADGAVKLAPLNCCLIKTIEKKVTIDSLASTQFGNVPEAKKKGQLSMLDEERIMAYYAGGKLYATPQRVEPWL